MANKRSNEKPPPSPPQVSPEQGIALLEDLAERGQKLLSSRPLSSDEHSAWKLRARNILEKAFGQNSPNVSSIMDAGIYGAFPMNAGEGFWENHRVETLTTQIRRTKELIELLRTEAQLQGAQHTVAQPQATGRQVFVVHGHDDAILHETARLLERLGVSHAILREMPNKGRTIIEKFEELADVGFAVVLLTADDRGGTRAQPLDAQKPRARQNVILELGYFLGRLGRHRVCALYRPGVEIPSDYSGVLYVELDDRGAWRWELAKELKAAGYSIDMNRAV